MPCHVFIEKLLLQLGYKLMLLDQVAPAKWAFQQAVRIHKEVYSHQPILLLKPLTALQKLHKKA